MERAFTMTLIGWSLFLIATGAILKWAVTVQLEGINPQNMGSS